MEETETLCTKIYICKYAGVSSIISRPIDIYWKVIALYIFCRPQSKAQSKMNLMNVLQRTSSAQQVKPPSV
jgi:hypothetical protein